jgi:hypothetical protein
MLSLVLCLLWLMLYIRVLYGLIAYLLKLWRGHGVGRGSVSDVVVCAAIYNCGWCWKEVGVAMELVGGGAVLDFLFSLRGE